MIDYDVACIVRGSLKPDLEVTITDEEGEVDFTGLTASMVTMTCEMDSTVVATGEPYVADVAPDGKSAVVKRSWVAGETDTVGRMWVSVTVDWPGAKPQTFPAAGPLRLDVVRAAGDA
jgi:hypothetical protein